MFQNVFPKDFDVYCLPHGCHLSIVCTRQNLQIAQIEEGGREEKLFPAPVGREAVESHNTCTTAGAVCNVERSGSEVCVLKR